MFTNQSFPKRKFETVEDLKEAIAAKKKLAELNEIKKKLLKNCKISRLKLVENALGKKKVASDEK